MIVTANKTCSRIEHNLEEPNLCRRCGWALDAHTDIQGTWTAASPEAPVGLDEWWADQVAIDIARTAPKIKEYGTKDLEAMGRLFAQIRGVEMRGDTAAVWGIMFYALGKIARAIASLERNEMPSEDTLFDLSVYAMMARAYQARGEL